MSLKELIQIGKECGCEERIREWIVSSVCSLGVSKSFNDNPVFDETYKEHLLGCMDDGVARGLGKSILDGNLVMKDEVGTKNPYGVTTRYYRVYVVKPNPEEPCTDDTKGTNPEPTSEEAVADTDSMG